MTAAATAEVQHPPAPLADRLREMKAAAVKRGIASAEQRIESLERLEDALLARKDALARAVSNDFGNRSRHETLFNDVYLVVSEIRHAKDHLRDWMEPEDREVAWTSAGSSNQVVYQPLGVVGIIAPWNFPILLALGPLVAALAAGNGAMLKPSELTPETSDVLAELVAVAFPSDHVTVVTGGPEVGEEFSRLPFDHLVFTGSTRVGKLVMRAASENLVPVTLELGGKCPTIVGPDFSVRTAAARIMAGKTLNGGQACIAPDYVFVPAKTRDAFVEACRAAVVKMYPSLETNPDYTTIVNDAHYERLQGVVEDARARGATVIELAPPPPSESRRFAPTLVLGATDEMLCMQDEIFGPILPILTYEKLEDVIDQVNARPRPLALYYFGYDRAAIDKVLAATVSGGVTLNETLLHIAQDDLPFGGVGPSGMGQYHGREGFVNLSVKKAVFRQSMLHTKGFFTPPFGKLTDRLLRFMLGA